MNDFPLIVDRNAPVPLHRQIYEALRAAILDRRIAAGTRLPPGRLLASQLGVSRATVTQAYEQLAAEGYVEARQGAGTFVADIEVFHRTPEVPARRPPLVEREDTSWSERPRFDFRYGSPDLEALPLGLWRQLLTRQWREMAAELLAYGDPAGWYPLREALAGYLARARAVRCTAETLLVTTGSQQALDLIARAVLRPGDRVVMEEPGYRGARRAFAASGATIVPVAVDENGLDPARLVALDPPPRLVYITPSHQFPTGAVMPLARRLALLDWADRAGAILVEDDYDSEFRYRGAPLAALQGLDTGDRVFYVGTFSKSFFPALRLGYLVAPPGWFDVLVAFKEITDRHSPLLEQAAMAEFVGRGHFERSIRRLRRRYSHRREILLAALEDHGYTPAATQPAGLHVLLPLPPGVDEAHVVGAAGAAGVAVTPGAPYSALSSPPAAILLGYTAIQDAQIKPGIERLARIIRGFERTQATAGRIRA